MRLLAALTLTCCTFGGGPTLGIGRKGVFVGAEVGGGLEFAQATLGAQTRDRAAYVRFDAVVGGPGSIIESPLGARFSLASGTDGFQMMSAGVRAGWHRENGDSCATIQAVVIGAEVRFTGDEWQVVLAPRFEMYPQVCYRFH